MDVELVELGTIAPPPRGPGARQLFGAGMAALVGLTVLAGLPDAPTKELAEGSATTDGRASNLPILAVTAPSAPLASPFPWAWTAFESRGFGRGATMANLWVVGDRFVAEIETDDGPDGGPYGPVSSVLVTSADGITWEDISLPARGFSIETGTVVDARLVLLGRVGTDDTAPRELWSTEDGTWRREPDPVGLAKAEARVVELAHAHECARGDCAGPPWAAIVGVPGSSLYETLRVSQDGVTWDPTTEVLDEPASLSGLTRYRGSWYVVSSSERLYAPQVYTHVLASSDGAAWTAAEISATTGGGRGLAAGAAGLALVGRVDSGPVRSPYVWLSPDGQSWEQLAADLLPARPPAGMDIVVSAGPAYVAISRLSGDAWVSTDGESWRNLPAFHAQTGDMIAALASLEDILLAVGRSAAGRPAYWRTTLGSLLAVP